MIEIRNNAKSSQLIIESNCRFFLTQSGYLQLEYQHHLIVVLKSIVQIDQFGVVQLIHDVDLLSDQFLLHYVRYRDEFGGEDVAGGPLSATVHHSERAGADFLENVVLVVDRSVFDLDRLWHVLAVHVEHKLVVIARLLVLASANLLAACVHLVFLLLELALDHALRGYQRRHLARIGSAVYVLRAYTEVILLAGAQTGHRERAESGVAGADPATHRMLALLNHVVGDVAATVPYRRLPAHRERVVANVIHLRESGRIRSIADLNLDDSRILAEIVLGGDAIRARIDTAAVADRQYGVTLLHLDGVMTTGFDHLALAYPRDLRFRIAGERDLDHDVHALVEESGITESRRHIQLRWCLNEELALCGLHAALVHRTAEVFIGVFAEHVVDDEIVSVALGINIVATAAYDLASALEPRDGRFWCADDLALEVCVVVLDAIYLIK